MHDWRVRIESNERPNQRNLRELFIDNTQRHKSHMVSHWPIIILCRCADIKLFNLEINRINILALDNLGIVDCHYLRLVDLHSASGLKIRFRIIFLNINFMLFEVNILIAILASVLVINLSLISVAWRFYRDKISSIITQKPSLEALDLNYQLKDHTPRIWSRST